MATDFVLTVGGQPVFKYPARVSASRKRMNHIDAVMLVAEAKPRLAIPCHFWTFAKQGAGDPGGFINACARVCPQVEARLLKPGERLILEP